MDEVTAWIRAQRRKIYQERPGRPGRIAVSREMYEKLVRRCEGEEQAGVIGCDLCRYWGQLLLLRIPVVIAEEVLVTDEQVA